jgi:hypothetical protein
MVRDSTDLENVNHAAMSESLVAAVMALVCVRAGTPNTS